MSRIDVHHHIIPPEYIERLDSLGIKQSFGVKFPKWTPEISLSFMKKNNIRKAITSITTPGVSFGDKQTSRDLARQCNEYMAKLKRQYPHKFGGFASLPLPDIEGSLDELKYALDKLNLDGVALLTHYKGKYLGDEIFEPIFAELNKRNAVVFIHPTDPAGQYDPKLGIPNALIEATFETTRAVTNMIYTGVTDRYKKINYILSHGGGTLPYTGWRVALVKYGQKGKKPPFLRSLYDFIIKGGPEKGLDTLKNMYYDTALTASEPALKALEAFVGPDHIVFGSDFVMAKLAPIVAKNLQKYAGFTEYEHDKIDYMNAVTLFPE